MSTPAQQERPRKSVLVVDDDIDNREVMALILRRQGYTVIEAADGETALAELRRADTPSLIILDLMMPRMNGWEFLSCQRAEPRLAAIPVLLISAGVMLEQEVTDAGAAAGLRKPLVLDELIATVQRLAPR
jgi:CheY-like chemotaxis protein